MSSILDLIPGWSAMRTYVYIAGGVFILTVASVAIWHYNAVTSELAAEKVKNTTLSNAVVLQTQTINAAKADIVKWQVAQKQLTDTIAALNKANQEAQLYTRRLSEIYAQHNLEDLSRHDPSAIETRINRGTDSAERLLTCVSGSDYSNCGDGSTHTRQNTPATKPNGNPSVTNSLGSPH